MIKINVVDHEKLYNFIVKNFLIWIHLGFKIWFEIFFAACLFTFGKEAFAECFLALGKKTLGKPFNTREKTDSGSVWIHIWILNIDYLWN